MKILTRALTLAAVLLPSVAFAQAVTDPVNRIMEIAKARWETTEALTPDYFDGLDEDFTKGFAEVYRGAAKYPAYDEGDSPFDYDVITSSQDGCPLKDVSVSPDGEKEGVTTVAVSFKLWTCAPDAESQAKVNTLRFDVVMENGKPLIADIHRFNEGKWDTLVGEMKEKIEIGKTGEQQ
ncbi:MAG: hypothetical protein EOP18_12455 [Rhizobiaceae bacterium]|nr:MAG: hypothetical protein EOP18_12455 [Rhizobiaceae bacterium]